jgi:phosphoenolpyruvate carboxykinase (GTP)
VGAEEDRSRAQENNEMTTNQELAAWVKTVAALTQPDRIHWCDGSPEEHGRLIDEMLASGTLIKLNEKTHPNCFLHRSDPSDVARVEHLTYV